MPPAADAEVRGGDELLFQSRFRRDQFALALGNRAIPLGKLLPLLTQLDQRLVAYVQLAVESPHLVVNRASMRVKRRSCAARNSRRRLRSEAAGFSPSAPRLGGTVSISDKNHKGTSSLGTVPIFVRRKWDCPLLNQGGLPSILYVMPQGGSKPHIRRQRLQRL